MRATEFINEAVGIITKQNATKDAPIGSEFANVKKLGLGSGKPKLPTNENFADGKQFRVTKQKNGFTVDLYVDGNHAGQYTHTRNEDNVRNFAEIFPEFRNKGHGGMLLLKAIATADDLGMDFEEDSHSLTPAMSRLYDELDGSGLIYGGGGAWTISPTGEDALDEYLSENFKDGKVKGKKEVWESVTPFEIFNLISNIHTGHNDIETDEEFQQWVDSFDRYELKDIPLSKLTVSPSNINPDKAKSYIKQKNSPPIVVDGTNYWIIDGHHRVEAALARGDKTIKGYVGLNDLDENFKDGKVKGKSRPGRVKRAGASCKGSISSLRAKAKKYSGEKGKMYHWCANMKSGKK